MSWFAFTLVAMLMSGIQSFLFKKSADMGLNKYLLTFYMYICQVVFAAGAFVFLGAKNIDIMKTVFFAVLLAIVFFIKLTLDLKALEYLPTNVIIPMLSSNMIIVIAYGYFGFNERFNIYQLIGVLIIFASTVLINLSWNKTEKSSQNKKGMIFVFISIVFSAGVVIINKYAAVYTNPIAFNVIVQFLLMIISASVYFITKPRGEKSDIGKFKNTIGYGLAVGVIGFIFYFSYLSALSMGPVSIIQPVLSLAGIITVLLAWLILKEKLSLIQFLLVLISIGGVIMTRIT
ncbi:MAG: DMT family transporter [Ignavibacteriales bacterium]